MNDTQSHATTETETPEYTPPEVWDIGTLQELTLGGGFGPDDGNGGAGDNGSLPF